MRFRSVLLSASLSGLLITWIAGCGCAPREEKETSIQLSHEQTLKWIRQHRAWRLAKKTRPIWARPVLPQELGTEFQTADRAVEKAREGFWLCVGVAGEPWFQKPERISARYEEGAEESKQFSFDTQSRRYRLFKPKGDVRNWVAQVTGPGISGFHIQPNYDTDHPLYSPAGGYAVMDHVPDPYKTNPTDVWLVQEGLFKSTYEIIDP